MSLKFALRVFLAVLMSPAWLPAYVLLISMGYVAAILVNLILFIGKGETYWDCLEEVNYLATLRFLRPTDGGMN